MRISPTFDYIIGTIYDGNLLMVLTKDTQKPYRSDMNIVLDLYWKRKFKLICNIINCSHSCSIKKQNNDSLLKL